MKWIISVTFFAALVNAGVARAWSLGDAIGHKDIQAGHQALHFDARQLPGNGTINVPPECKAICDPVVAAPQTCTALAQCCTAAFENAFFGCFLCVGGIDFNIPQQTLDGLVLVCASQLGIAIPRLTFPGQDPSRPLSLPGSSTANPTPTLPSGTAALNSTTAPVNPPIPTSTIPAPQTTATSPPTTTVEPNTLPDPTDTAFAPPSSSGWRTTSGGWWAGIMVLTLGGLLGGWCL